PLVNAHLDGNVTTATNLTVETDTTDRSSATSKAVSGGLFSGQNNDASASTQPHTTAGVNGSSINVTSNLKVHADARPEGDAQSTGGSYGGVAIGASKSTVT